MNTRRTWIVAILLFAALVSGCGGDTGGGDKPQAPPPVARPEDFPKPAGRSLADLVRKYGEGGPVLASSVSQLKPGPNRFGFGLFDRSRAQIADAPVGVYIAPSGGGPAKGPFLAHYESLAVKGNFLSKGVESDPNAAKSVYVTDVRFPKAGRYEVLGLVRLDDRLVAATPAGPAMLVQKQGPVPDVGDPAPKIHTPTKTDVGGDLSKIDTRVPPSTQQEVDFANVVGKKPAILLFATPALCQSRVCGPVEDIVEQVKAGQNSDDVAFVHMEIYNDNQIDKGFRPQVVQWKLPTEPWLFAVDRRGRIAARMEGAFSVAELNRAIKAAKRG